jgi:hypothetical protein
MTRLLTIVTLLIYQIGILALPVLSPVIHVHPQKLQSWSIAFSWRFAWCIATNIMWGILSMVLLDREEECTQGAL